MGMAAPAFYTAEMVRALPEDGNRYETVHGELLVTPAPRELHQRVVGRLFLEIGTYIARSRLWALYASPADISWGPEILVQPDIFVVDLEEARSGDWRHMRTLLLAIEVLSASTSRQDRFTKRRLYQEVGIPLAWFVDCDARHVEVWTPGAVFPVIERERVTWHPAGAPEPAVIQLESLFQPL
jgi:Uma2 family endonuclease